MKSFGVKVDCSNNFEENVGHKMNIFFLRDKNETTDHKYHINYTFPLLLLLLMSCDIVVDYAYNSYLLIINGNKNNDSKYYQIIKLTK